MSLDLDEVRTGLEPLKPRALRLSFIIQRYGAKESLVFVLCFHGVRVLRPEAFHCLQICLIETEKVCFGSARLPALYCMHSPDLPMCITHLLSLIPACGWVTMILLRLLCCI